MTDFTMNIDADGIAIITWDCPNPQEEEKEEKEEKPKCELCGK